MNSTKIVYISDVVPDANGNVLLDFSTTQAAQWAFNAGIIIQEYSDASGGSILYTTNSVLDSASGVDPSSAQYRFRVYPNPFRAGLNIEFYNPESSDKISTELYDLGGRLVYRQQFHGVARGNNILRLENLSLGSKGGVYIVVLKVGGKTIGSLKLLKAP
jgi:hypothetical protein